MRLSIVSTKYPWHWLSVSGHVVEIRPDEGLVIIDRMAHTCTREPYAQLTLRDIFVIEIDRAHTSWA